MQYFVEGLNSNSYFTAWHRGRKDACNNSPCCSPIELLLLGALKYLGRKCTSYDLEQEESESTFISERTHEQLFQHFIMFGSSDLYTQFVWTPQTNEEIDKKMKQARYDPGAGDSTDVVILNCRYAHRQAHLGPKISKPSCSHNETVSHRRCILSRTSGHLSRWNDKTLILYDDFGVGLKEGTIILEDYKFNLSE